MSNPNPFIQQNYYIYESPTWPSCTSGGPVSHIVMGNVPPDATSYTVTGPNDFFFIEKYVSSELKKLLSDIVLVKRCDSYGYEKNAYPNITMTPQCSTFKNFANYTSPYTTQIINTQIMQTGMFDKIVYTDTSKKQICQRVNDITQMLTDMSNILFTIKSGDNSMYSDKHDAIIKEFQQNLTMRDELQDKLNEIYGANNAKYDNSKLYLDSTIYTNVLWTILATTILIYIFRRL